VVHAGGIAFAFLGRAHLCLPVNSSSPTETTPFDRSLGLPYSPVDLVFRPADARSGFFFLVSSARTEPFFKPSRINPSLHRILSFDEAQIICCPRWFPDLDTFLVPASAGVFPVTFFYLSFFFSSLFFVDL